MTTYIQNQLKNKLLLKYRQPFDFKQLLSFMAPRQHKGVEIITEDSYSRAFRTEHEHISGYFCVTDHPEKYALQLSIYSDDRRCYTEIFNKVRSMFDLDTDFSEMRKIFSKSNLLSKGMKNGFVPRLPRAFNVFEFIIRAIIGQQISVKGATTISSRLVERAHIKTGKDFLEGLDYFYPTPEELLKINLENIGLSKTRQETLKTVVEAILNKKVSLNIKQTLEDLQEDFIKLKGIGDWTVNYVAMRGFGIVDCFPATDLGIMKALSKNGKMPNKKEAVAIAEKWRPYRSYATLCLWNIS